MDRLVLALAAIALGILSYTLWHENGRLQEDISEEIEKNKISISSTILTEATEFTFMKVTNQFMYYMDAKPVKKSPAKWQAVYQWDYTFNFGFEIDEGWNWCIKVDEQAGIVTLNAPAIKQLNQSSASPTPVKIINGGNRKTSQAAAKLIRDTANRKVRDAARVYLENRTVQSSVKKSLASFFQDILNDAHENSNPISKVVVNIVGKSTCDE